MLDEPLGPSYGEEPSVFLIIRIPNPVATISTEYQVYNGDDLAGDAGGMVGMLLGMSVLAAYDALTNTVIRLKRKFCALIGIR